MGLGAYDCRTYSSAPTASFSFCAASCKSAILMSIGIARAAFSLRAHAINCAKASMAGALIYPLLEGFRRSRISLPGSTEKLTPSTARTSPSSVKNEVRRDFTSSSATGVLKYHPGEGAHSGFLNESQTEVCATERNILFLFFVAQASACVPVFRNQSSPSAETVNHPGRSRARTNNHL